MVRSRKSSHGRGRARGRPYLLAAASVVLALLQPPAALAAPHPLVGDAAEQEVLRLIRGEKYIRAREQAEKLLQDRPDSILLGYALVRIFHDEEANLPRALYHAERVERTLLQRHGDPPASALAQEWHRKLLEEQESLLSELDRREEQLAVIDRYDRLYKPPLDYRRVWALMKLHRFDEAVRIAREVSLSSDLALRISGLNGMIAIEMERQRPRACFRTAKRAVSLTGERSCILLHNAAESAFGVYRFGEAEELARKALRAEIKDCPNTSYPHLASLYLLRGDFQQAMEAVRAARAEGVRKRYRQQFEMENTAWLLRLLYVLGRFDKVEELGERMVRAPDRVGMTSLSPALTRLASVVEYHAALGALMESLREQASARPLLDRVQLWLRLRRLEQRAWALRRQAARLLAEEVTLRQVLRPYFTPLLPWLAGEIIPVAGEGVVLAALGEARVRERMKQETAPYYAALEGEARYRSGELTRALELARQARRGLPRDEVLLRARIDAWSADAAQRLGRTAEAAKLFHEVLHRLPTALRILDIRLPVSIRAGAHPLAREVAERLMSSRRLDPAGGAFVVRVTGEGSVVRACVEASSGHRYGCAETTVTKDLDQDEQVARVIDNFHVKAFAPKIDLTQRDINSLDGSAVRGDADTLIDKVLGK